MLQELISSKHVGNPAEYMELEEKALQQKTAIQELKAHIQDLDKQLKVKGLEERQLRDKLKEFEKNEGNTGKLKEKLKDQRTALEEEKAKIDAFETENTELRRELEELRITTSKQVVDTALNSALEQQKADLEKLTKDKEDLKKRADAADRRAQEKEREARDEKSRAKEHEDEYELKNLEEKERLNQRIVRRTVIRIIEW